MSEREERFRRLGAGGNGDLFEHFGVELQPSNPDPLPTPRLARTCRACGWYAAPDAACENCGEKVEAG